MPHSEHLQIIDPPALARPRGYAHGVLAPSGARVLFVAGQTAADDGGTVTDRDFVAQFDVALGKVIQVVESAGGVAQQIARLTIYVTDLEAYRAGRSGLRAVWARRMGTHYPAIALVQVTGLVDAGALVEIQADAVLR